MTTARRGGAGTPILQENALENLRVVEPVRAVSDSEARGTLETADGKLRLRVRAVMGAGATAAVEFTLMNIGTTGVPDLPRGSVKFLRVIQWTRCAIFWSVHFHFAGGRGEADFRHRARRSRRLGSLQSPALCENCDQSDPTAYVTYRPMKHLSYTRKLIAIAMSGKHYNVKVDPLSLQQLIAWVDANCPSRGEEDMRAIPDPIAAGLSIPPRCKSAPMIERP